MCIILIIAVLIYYGLGNLFVKKRRQGYDGADLNENYKFFSNYKVLTYDSNNVFYQW